MKTKQTKTRNLILIMLIAVFVSSCDDNPSCSIVTLAPGETSAVIANISDADLELTAITIEDQDGNIPSEIILCAPDHDEDDLCCKFVYPETQDNNTYEGNAFELTGTVFRAENVVQRIKVQIFEGDNVEYTYLTPSYCPVEKHQGQWSLYIEYEEETTTDRKVKVCFYYDE